MQGITRIYIDSSPHTQRVLKQVLLRSSRSNNNAYMSVTMNLLVVKDGKTLMVDDLGDRSAGRFSY